MLTTTRRLTIAAALTAGMALTGTGAAVAAPASYGGKKLSTTLTPAQEVAPFIGVAGASGSATLRFNPGQGTICVDITTDGLADLALAHIHEAARDTNGDVVVNLTSLIDGDSASGCVTPTRTLFTEILENPADYYVNTHEGAPGTDGFSRGIRGQLG